MSQIETTKAKGIQLPCPHCGEPHANMSVLLSDASILCQECDTEVTREDIEGFVRKWMPVLNWIDAMPASEEE